MVVIKPEFTDQIACGALSSFNKYSKQVCRAWGGNAFLTNNG